MVGFKKCALLSQDLKLAWPKFYHTNRFLCMCLNYNDIFQTKNFVENEQTNFVSIKPFAIRTKHN